MIRDTIKKILHHNVFPDGGMEGDRRAEEGIADQILQALIEALPKEKESSDDEYWGTFVEGFNEALNLVKKSYEEKN